MLSRITHCASPLCSRLCLVTALLLCIAGSAHAQRSNSRDYQLLRGLEVFNDITRQLDAYYVDTLSIDTVVRWAIDGMLARVDPFTTYYPGDDMDELKQMATGKYAGIGAVIRWRPSANRCIVSEPYEGTPAQQAGLRAGDVIMAIDDHDVEGMAVSKVSSMLRGEAGTTFVLDVKRGDTPLQFKITRRNIQLPQVPYHGLVADGVGYLPLTGFTEGAAQEVRRTLAALMKQGARQLVFDLRGNTGGSLEEAVNIVGLFVPHGSLVVSMRGKVAGTCREQRTTTEPLAPDMPVCVLVDNQTASSSEIVSGALQDMDRAVIIGQRTYGKGLVQSIRDTPYNGSLKLTTSRYYIPSGRCIQAYDYRHLNPDGSVGLVPDSVTRLFHTAAGRPVRDGGGIKPDVELVPDSFPTFLFDLLDADAFTDWCVDYATTHDSIASPADFALTADDWASFTARVEASGFKCRRRSSTYLSRLREVARLEGFEQQAAASLDALDSLFTTTSIRTDMERFRLDITRYLEADIVRAYYYQRGGVQHSLRDDRELQRAIEILTTGQYNQILHP